MSELIVAVVVEAVVVVVRLGSPTTADGCGASLETLRQRRNWLVVERH